jgi:hypothetical protein
MDIGNELRAGHVSPARFRDMLNRRLPFLGHIQISSVYVVNHLGQTIPVPTIFCANWKVIYFYFSHEFVRSQISAN